MIDNVTDHPCTALLLAAEQLIAHVGESDERDAELLLDLATACSDFRQRISRLSP